MRKAITKKFILGFAIYQISDEKEKHHDSATEHSLKSAVFLLRILTEAIEIVVVDKKKFEYRSILLYIPLSGFFGQSRIGLLDRKKIFVI